MARPAGEINAGSMADIAFLMLIFFLVTTTMNSDKGLARRLPPMPDDTQIETDIKVNRRNVLAVYVNNQDRLLVGGQVMDVSLLKEKVRDFIVNPEMSEKRDSTFAGYGTFPISRGVVSLQNDRGTSYDIYIRVQNELVKAFNELRDDFSQRQFGKSFAGITEEQRDLVRKVYPQNISEAEPVEAGNKKK